MEDKEVKYYVGVFAKETDEFVAEILAGTSVRSAEHIERGMNINLDHERFYTDWYTKEGEDDE